MPEPPIIKYIQTFELLLLVKRFSLNARYLATKATNRLLGCSVFDQLAVKSNAAAFAGFETESES